MTTTINVRGSAAPASRNPTEDAILSAARDALAEQPYSQVTVDAIARRAYVSRTTVYFYFPNKRAVVDRLIQRAFSDMYENASPYLEGAGDPRAELRAALGGVVAVVDRDAQILRLALRLYGEEDRLPAEWAPYIDRLVRAAARRIARDQRRGLAPDDIPARHSALAMAAMVERHVGMEIIRGRRDGHESIVLLSELWWRGVYSRPDA
jgi:AcrR family transcriptional regulator